jgi:outer membrane protein insertion porin family
LVGFLQLTKLNLFGLGIRIGAEWEIGQKKRNISLDYYDPYYWDSPVSLGLGVWDTDRDLSNTYEQLSTGGSVSFGWRLSENTRVTFAYKYEVDTIKALSGVPLPSGVSTEPQATSGPSLTLNYDTRDSIFDPMKGWSHQILAQVAGGPYPEGGINFLGGDTKFYKVTYDVSYFQPFPIRVPLVGRPSAGFHMRTGRGWGAGGQDLPIFERFFLGGTDSIRGYGEREIGPIDSSTGQPSGGRSMWQLNAELKWPVYPRVVTIAAPFFDIGNAWGKFDEESHCLARSVGLGLRLTIPGTIMVVRVDYGWGLSEPFNNGIKDGKFHFNIGNIF